MTFEDHNKMFSEEFLNIAKHQFADENQELVKNMHLFSGKGMIVICLTRYENPIEMERVDDPEYKYQYSFRH